MAVLAIVVWASIMWVSEALPVGITGISIPTLLLLTQAIPWKDGKAPMATVFSGFTSPEVWLCLFAFFVGAVMQLLRMDRRIALGILDKVRASSVGRVIWGMFGVNIALAFLIPAANARAATLMPVVKGITNLLGGTPEEQEAKKAIVIQSLVYGCMICGVFILTAHMPNLIMVGIFGNNGFPNLSYLNWAILQFPYLGMFVLTQWWVRYHFKTASVQIVGGHTEINKQYRELGPMTGAEWILLGVFAGVALLFAMGNGSPIYALHQYPLGIVGLIGILILFTPGLFPFKWKEVQDRTIWGTFLLLGGALTLTAAMSSSGLAGWLADHIHGAVVGLPVVGDRPRPHGRHPRHSHWHAVQCRSGGHAGPHNLCYGAQGGVAPGGLHPSCMRYRHLRLPAPYPNHRRGYRLWHRNFQYRGLRQSRLGLHSHRHGLRPPGHGPLVRLSGVAGMESSGTLALLRREKDTGIHT